MAANYTASTNNHLFKCRSKLFLALKSFSDTKNYTASQSSTSMLHVVTGNAKKMIIYKQHINYEEFAQK